MQRAGAGVTLGEGFTGKRAALGDPRPRLMSQSWANSDAALILDPGLGKGDNWSDLRDDVHGHGDLEGAVIFSSFVQAAAVAPKCAVFIA